MSDADLDKSYSSYGLVTVQRIFDCLGVQLTQDELLAVNQHPNSCYYQLLQVPLKNIFNGIIIEQASDYREYAQKMMIDYLISGAANLPEDQAKPVGAKLDLEAMRVDLIAEGDKYDLLQFEHHKLILDSQKLLIKFAKTLPKPPQVVAAPTSDDFLDKIRPFVEQAESLAERIKAFRTQFYKYIITARELLNTLPDYFNRFQGSEQHHEALNFNAVLGDNQAVQK
jgi:hypothetical protein